MDFDREIPELRAHRVAAASRPRVDMRELSGQRRLDDRALAVEDAADFAGSQVGRRRALAAMQATHRRAQALVLEPERAVRIALAAETAQAAQKSDQALLPALEERVQLAFEALGHERRGMHGLIDHGVVRGPIGERRDDRRQADVGDDQRQSERGAE